MQLPCAYYSLGTTVQIRVEQSYLHEGLGQFNCEIISRASVQRHIERI
jgi:hypothetical protein